MVFALNLLTSVNLKSKIKKFIYSFIGRKGGCLTKKRQLLFWYKKKHSDYENPNACGRM